MSRIRTIVGYIDALVHVRARTNPLERLQHQVFIAAHGLSCLSALALLPVWLTFGRAHDPWLIFAIACLIVPALAVVIVCRTGNIVAAQPLCLAGLFGLVVTVAMNNSDHFWSALAWLVIAPVDAVLTLNLRVLAASIIGAAAVMAGVLFLHMQGYSAPHPMPALMAASLFFTHLLALMVAIPWYVTGISRLSRRIERLGEARYLTLAEAVGDLVLRHDRSGAILFASPESEILFQIPPADLVGRGFYERIHVADRPDFLKTLSEACSTSRTITTTLRLSTPAAPLEDGAQSANNFRWVEMRTRRMDTDANSDDSDSTAMVSVIRDITLRKQHEQTIEQAREEAERATLLKDRLLANVSHELRTPLNAIIGFSDMLSSETMLVAIDADRQKEYAKIINKSGQHLLSVVNSILDISRIESGRLDIIPEPFDIAPLVEGCHDMLSLAARQNDVTLEHVLAPALPELVADKRACKQILINLLSNGVKFTPSGGRVCLRVWREGNSIVFSVTDTGVGIHAPDLPRIGSAFFQAHNAYNRQYEGTGLGLSIVRGLVGLHGGSMSIESTAGEGTCVSVRLPVHGPATNVANTSVIPIETSARFRRSPPDHFPAQTSLVKKIA